MATDIESKKVIPLYFEAYSHLAEDIKSENTQILKALRIILKHTGDKGIHTMDRGGDQGIFYIHYLDRDKPIRFVIQLKQRELIHKGKRKDCLEIAQVLPTPHETVLMFL